MSTRPNALGRGLGALLPGAPPSARVETARPSAPESGPQQIPVDAIDPNPEQPRRTFDPEQLLIT